MPYVDVNGICLYYEEQGTGFPLVLLHGGLLTIELNFGAVIPALSEHRRVIALEFQGHGRTVDNGRPMAIEHLAADVVALLDDLGIQRVDIFGFSLGGLTAYELLVRHHDRIRRAVVASADHRNERGGEAYPERLPTAADFAQIREAYTAVAPNPAHFDVVAKRVPAMVEACRGWSDEQLRSIEGPVLVLLGDADFILVPNAAASADLMPLGQLAVLPGTTHMGIIRSELILPIVERFLKQRSSGDGQLD